MRRTVEKDRRSRLVQSEAGQASIEFVFTITITLLLLFGLIDFGRAIYTTSVIQWAAQQGARAGLVESSPAEIVAVVHERMIGLNNCPTPEACIVVSNPDVNIVRVDVTYEFEFITPIVAQITGKSIEMHASASMVAY